MMSLFEWLISRHNGKPVVPARPAYIRRDADGKMFYRRSNGIYESDADHEFLSMTFSQDILKSRPTGYTISRFEAPDFHAPYDGRGFGSETGSHYAGGEPPL